MNRGNLLNEVCLIDAAFNPQLIRFEILSLPIGKGDHSFVVIDRDPNSDLSDPSKWGSRAILIDPWYHEMGYIHQLKKSGAMKQINRYKKNIEILYQGEIGSGHTKRWYNKKRSEFFFCQREARKNDENLEFISFKFNRH